MNVENLPYFLDDKAVFVLGEFEYLAALRILPRFARELLWPPLATLAKLSLESFLTLNINALSFWLIIHSIRQIFRSVGGKYFQKQFNNIILVVPKAYQSFSLIKTTVRFPEPQELVLAKSFAIKTKFRSYSITHLQYRILSANAWRCSFDNCHQSHHQLNNHTLHFTTSVLLRLRYHQHTFCIFTNRFFQ